MTAKMYERMKNFAGNPRALLAVRVSVVTITTNEQGIEIRSYGEGIFPVHPNKKLRINKQVSLIGK